LRLPSQLGQEGGHADGIPRTERMMLSSHTHVALSSRTKGNHTAQAGYRCMV